MESQDLDLAVAEMLGVLGPHLTADWDVPAGRLEWTCRQTAAHIAHDLAAYAGQLAAGAADAYLPYDLVVRADAGVQEVLQVVVASGRLLSIVLATAGPDARAWRWGPTDTTGFAALGVTETLLHTWDITQGLGVPWRPPATLAAGVLARLFPNAPEGDPVDALLWCTGRIDLPGRPRLRSWVMRAAIAEEMPATG